MHTAWCSKGLVQQARDEAEQARANSRAALTEDEAFLGGLAPLTVEVRRLVVVS